MLSLACFLIIVFFFFKSILHAYITSKGWGGADSVLGGKQHRADG